MFKKAQASNYFAAIIFLFIFGFLSIFGYLLLTEYIAVYATTDFYGPQVENAAVQFLFGMEMFDWVIVLLMFVLIVGIGVTSFRVATAPIFFLITLVLGAFYGFVSFFFNHIFQEMVSDPIFTSTLLYFPKTYLICTNLHWIMLVLIVVGSITLYGKREKGQFLA